MGKTSWRKSLNSMRTYAVFRCDPPAPAAVQLAARLPTPTLLAAAHNPSHADGVRAFLLEGLKGRGDGAHEWRLSVPGFLRARDLQLRTFFGWGRRVRMASGFVLFLAIVAIIALVAWAEPASERLLAQAIAQGLLAETSADETLLFWSEPEAQGALASLGPSPDTDRVRNGVMLAWPVTALASLSLLVWIGASALRRRPARILLLRRFNEKKIAAKLKAFLRNELLPFGHIVTLADKHLKHTRAGWLQMALLAPGNPLAALVLLLGLPLRLFDRSRFGPALVWSAWDFRNVARRLRDRIGLNLVVLGTTEAFVIRTSDQWWQAVVRLLFDSCDAVVVDLTQVAAGTEWELERIREYGLAPACIFVARSDASETAEATLRAWGFDRPLFAYDDFGDARERARFRHAMLEAMRAALTQRAGA